MPVRDDRQRILGRIREILGSCPPWSVSHYVESGDPRVWEIYLQHDADAQFCCAMCTNALDCHGHGAEWIFRCLQCEDVRVYVRFQIPMVDCPAHGLQHADVHWLREGESWRFVRCDYGTEELIAGRIH